MKNIAMIACTNFTSDSRVQREALAAVEAGYNVDFYITQERNPRDFEGVNFIRSKFGQYDGDSKIRFITRYLRFVWFCFWKITFNHFKKKYQVVHINNMPNFLVFSCMAIKWMGAKLILDVHDLMPEVYAEKFDRPLSHWMIKLLYLEERWSANFCHEVIVTNRLQIARLKQNKVRRFQFPEILNAADENVFRPFTDHNFHDRDLTIVFPSTIARRLGLDVLIDAMEIVEKSNPHISLRIFGGGEYTEQLIALIKEKGLNNTRFEGGIGHSELSEVMEKAHMGIVPYPDGHSTNYQMPIKIHEYFVKGLAVISSDVNIIKEYFSQQIVLFKAGDAEDFAAKILELAADPQKMLELSRKGHAFYQENRWSRYKEDYVQTLKRLALS